MRIVLFIISVVADHLVFGGTGQPARRWLAPQIPVDVNRCGRFVFDDLRAMTSYCRSMSRDFFERKKHTQTQTEACAKLGHD